MARVIFLLTEEKIFFRNQAIRNKNCLWRPCLSMDRDEMSYLYRGPSIDASYQVSVHLADGFQRRLKCEKLTDDIRRTPSDGKSSHCLWQGELKKKDRHVRKESLNSVGHQYQQNKQPPLTL